MAKFTSTAPLNMRLPGGFEAVGAAGTTHRIPDSLLEEFLRDQAPFIPGLTWITQDETSAVSGFDPSTKFDKVGGIISGSVTATGTMQAANGRFKGSPWFDVMAYGGVADGVTDNASAFAAALADVPSAGGVIFFPAGTYAFATPMNISAKTGVVIRGAGGQGLGTTGATVLIFTGTASQVINMQSTFGCRVQDVTVLYSNASFAGAVVDLRNTSGLDPSYCAVERCTLGGVGGAVGASAAVALDKATRAVVRDTLILNCQIGVLGKSSATYSNQISIINCSFRSNVLSNIRNAGQGWLISTCEFNPLANGKAGLYDHDSGVTADGLTIQSCWAGDVTDASNPSSQIKVAGSGISIVGNFLGGSATCTGVTVDAASNGVDIRGNKFDTMTVGINWGTGNTRIKSEGNHYTSVTTKETPNPRRFFLAAHEATIDGSTLTSASAQGVPDAAPAINLVDGSTTGAYWLAAIPSDWGGGALGLVAAWVAAATDSTAHSVRFTVDAIMRTGSAGQSISTGGTITTWTGDSSAHTGALIYFETEVALGITPANAGDLLRINIRRVGADAADTYVGDVRLLGVFITY